LFIAIVLLGYPLLPWFKFRKKLETCKGIEDALYRPKAVSGFTMDKGKRKAQVEWLGLSIRRE